MNKKEHLHMLLAGFLDESVIDEKLKALTFLEYYKLTESLSSNNIKSILAILEANVDGSGLNSATTGPASTKPTNYTSIPKVPVSALTTNPGLSKSDSKELKKIEKNLDSKLQTTNTPISKNADSKIKDTVQAALSGNIGAAKDLIASFKKGYQAGNQTMSEEKLESTVDAEELKRLQELSGITTETTSAGCVAATSSSIVGNTSNSHRPTVKLGAQVRLDRVAKERKKLNKFKKD